VASVSDVMWIDESARASTAGLVYVIVGVRLIDDARCLIRMEELLLPSQRYLHWRDEPNARRNEIVAD
jgi:hypothetical protein